MTEERKEQALTETMSGHVAEKGSRLTDDIRTRPVIKGIQKRWLWIVVAVSVLAIGMLLGLYIKSQRQISELSRKIEQQQNDPTVKIKAETNDLLSKVGKLIVLPQDEQPTIATVTDLEKLKSQPFFEKAQLGDKVIIYTKAKKAILYRPEENKIVELAPLTTGLQSTSK